MLMHKVPSPRKKADDEKRLAKLVARIEKNLKAREPETGPQKP
jgi:hypothetical protein